MQGFWGLFSQSEIQKQNKEYAFLFWHTSEYWFQDSINLLEAWITLFNTLKIKWENQKSKFRVIYVSSESELWDNKKLTEIVSSLESNTDFVTLEFMFGQKIKKIHKDKVEFESKTFSAKILDEHEIQFNTLMINPRKYNKFYCWIK